MYALHGSLNSLGFALPATWHFALFADAQGGNSDPGFGVSG